ncbi:MAG: sugar phosphate isomerase/epimerase [Chitinophagaceae bacterium]|nr:sugar phosphate isomerase/epimerase [Chitinophagaceae bacterium]
MTYNRRQFLKAGALFGTGIALSAKSLEALAGNNIITKNFGLQLYSLRDDLPKDPKGILKQVAGFGYNQVESFEGAQGMFWGLGNTGFKKYMDQLGMSIVSSHCDINKDFEKKAGEAGAIGMKYLICPYIGAQKTLDDYKKFAEKFNACGDICKQNGLKFAYHNHGYTFKPVDGVYPQDVLMENTNPDTVDFEMDMYWVVTAGEDPVAWLEKYPYRFKLCHVKDREKGAGPDNQDASCDLGKGSIDYGKILQVAKKKGVYYYIVEQEKYTGSTPLKSAKACADYMNKLAF